MTIEFEIENKQMSVLSIADSNSIRSGDRVACDGYIYNGDSRKKFFRWREGWKHFWEPCLNDLSRIESLYHKLVQKQDKLWDRIREHLQHTVSVVAPTKGRHFDEEYYVYTYVKDLGWRKYSIRKDYEFGLCYSSECIDFLPSDVIDVLWRGDGSTGLGDELHRLNELVMGQRMWKISKLLDDAFIKFLESKKGSHTFKNSDIDRKFEIRVNGRQYIYRLVPRGRSQMYEKLCWIGDKYQVFEV